MSVSKINPNTGKLRVVHVATQAEPFISENMRWGLSQVASRLPAALTSLGVEASLVLPLFKQTKAIISERRLKLNRAGEFGIYCGDKIKKAKFKTMSSTTEPSYPIFFIEYPEYFELDEMYGYTKDLERFAFFCFAAISLQRVLETAPDVFDCHEWHSTLIPVYLNQLLVSETPSLRGSDKFFKDTKSVLTIHDFNFMGEVPQGYFHLAGQGWERHLPAYAEFKDRLNLLKAGLYRANRSCARSYRYIDSVVNGIVGPPDFSGIVKERLDNGCLVGLSPSDEIWRPDREFTDTLAREWARHALSLYRSVVERPFPAMEEAEQTYPPVEYQTLSASEKLEHQREISRQRLKSLNETFLEFYDNLSDKDKALIDKAIAAGEEGRFSRITKPEELENLLKFLRIKPTCDFEAKMREEGLGDFLDPELFYPGDINRILSLKLSLKTCKGLLQYKPELGQTGRITLFEAFSSYGDQSKTTLLQHITGLFRTLKLISAVAGKSEKELARELRQRSTFKGKESLANTTSDFRQFAEVYSFISLKENREYYRALLIAILLHDLGKLIEHDTHPMLSAKRFERSKELRALFSSDGFDFAGHLMKYHSIFGDAVVQREQDPDDIQEVFSLYKDNKTSDLLFKCLYLLGIADTSAVGQKGRLFLYSMRKARNTYFAVLDSRNKDELLENLNKAGIGQEKEGEQRWNTWVVRGEKDEDKKVRQADAALAEKELTAYCRLKLEAKIKELISEMNQAKPKRKRRSIQREINRLVEREKNSIKDQLGAVGHVWNIRSLTASFDDAKLRARLVIWFSEFSREIREKHFTFDFRSGDNNFSKKQKRLIALLEKFDLNEINNNIRADIKTAAKTLLEKGELESDEVTEDNIEYTRAVIAFRD